MFSVGSRSDSDSITAKLAWATMRSPCASMMRTPLMKWRSERGSNMVVWRSAVTRSRSMFLFMQ